MNERLHIRYETKDSLARIAMLSLRIQKIDAHIAQLKAERDDLLASAVASVKTQSNLKNDWSNGAHAKTIIMMLGIEQILSSEPNMKLKSYQIYTALNDYLRVGINTFRSTLSRLKSYGLLDYSDDNETWSLAE